MPVVVYRESVALGEVVEGCFRAGMEACEGSVVVVMSDPKCDYLGVAVEVGVRPLGLMLDGGGRVLLLLCAALGEGSF